jgi:hypothetical protein
LALNLRRFRSILAIFLVGCVATKRGEPVAERTQLPVASAQPVTATHEGRSVEYWMEQLSSYTNGSTHDAAEKAFKAMGKAAMPYVLSELRPPLGH